MTRGASTSTGEIKRRSRKGCWPCKGRKVKCDEKRPSCSNCIRHDTTCDYTLRLNWDGRSRRKKASENRTIMNLSCPDFQTAENIHEPNYDGTKFHSGLPDPRPESYLPPSGSVAARLMSTSHTMTTTKEVTSYLQQQRPLPSPPPLKEHLSIHLPIQHYVNSAVTGVDPCHSSIRNYRYPLIDHPTPSREFPPHSYTFVYPEVGVSHSGSFSASGKQTLPQSPLPQPVQRPLAARSPSTTTNTTFNESDRDSAAPSTPVAPAPPPRVPSADVRGTSTATAIASVAKVQQMQCTDGREAAARITISSLLSNDENDASSSSRFEHVSENHHESR